LGTLNFTTKNTKDTKILSHKIFFQKLLLNFFFVIFAPFVVKKTFKNLN